LSKFAGNKLVENNPAITDLSDPNRPTKLAEYFSELYDNEWTDAFEALKTAGYKEITAIETLRLTLEVKLFNFFSVSLAHITNHVIILIDNTHSYQYFEDQTNII
jgi:hypothetical protein